MTPVAIRLSGIEKSFGPVQANCGADLEVAQGEIHALVGENGAGKSTLMRILSGLYAPDAGRMEVNGRDITGWSTSEAIASGVGMVHQHFMLVPTLTVAENVVLGSEITKGIVLDRVAAERAVHDLSVRTGLAVPANRLVADLSVGEAQRVEILKTLYRGAKILILDEPTAVLSPFEVRELWAVLRSLRDDHRDAPGCDGDAHAQRGRDPTGDRARHGRPRRRTRTRRRVCGQRRPERGRGVAAA